MAIVDKFKEMWLRRGEHKNSAGGELYGIEVKDVLCCGHQWKRPVVVMNPGHPPQGLASSRN